MRSNLSDPKARTKKAARRKATSLVITCAVCNNARAGGTCDCNFRSGFEGSLDLIRAVARGEKTPADCQEWLDHEQAIADEFWRQRDQDQAEFHRAVDALMARAGTSSYGPSYALGYLMGRGGYPLCRGTDDEVYMQIRRHGDRVRLEHIRWARAWIRDEWLQGDTAKTLRRYQIWRRALLAGRLDDKGRKAGGR